MAVCVQLANDLARAHEITISKLGAQLQASQRGVAGLKQTVAQQQRFIQRHLEGTTDIIDGRHPIPDWEKILPSAAIEGGATAPAAAPAAAPALPPVAAPLAAPTTDAPLAALPAPPAPLVSGVSVLGATAPPSFGGGARHPEPPSPRAYAGGSQRPPSATMHVAETRARPQTSACRRPSPRAGHLVQLETRLHAGACGGGSAMEAARGAATARPHTAATSKPRGAVACGGGGGGGSASARSGREGRPTDSPSMGSAPTDLLTVALMDHMNRSVQQRSGFSARSITTGPSASLPPAPRLVQPPPHPSVVATRADGVLGNGIRGDAIAGTHAGSYAT